MSREFATWVQALPTRRTREREGKWYPRARTPWWLPPGWSEHHRLDGYTPVSDMYLLRRRVGGWALVIHDTEDRPRTQLHDTAMTLRCLYATYCDQTAAHSDREPLSLWLGRVMADLYDPTIEAEAAARMIVALGGAAPFEPSAALLLPSG